MSAERRNPISAALGAQEEQLASPAEHGIGATVAIDVTGNVTYAGDRAVEVRVGEDRVAVHPETGAVLLSGRAHTLVRRDGRELLVPVMGPPAHA